MRSFKRLLALFLAMHLFSSGVFSAELPQSAVDADRLGQRDVQQNIQTIKEKAHKEHQLDKKAERLPKEKSFRDKLHFYYTVLEGFDRNALLNSSHKGSLYTEQIGIVTYKDKYKDFFMYRLSYNLIYSNYYKFDANTFLDQGPRVETAIKLNDSLFLETDYHFRFFERPHDAQANFTKHDAKVGLKHEIILGKFYQKPSFIYNEHDYSKMKARDTSGALSNDSPDRQDQNYSFDYELGFQPTHHVLFQVHNRFGRNDSNDQFRDFYDYDYYRLRPVVIWKVTPPLLLVTGVEYQRNSYDDRNFSGSQGREDLYAVFGALYYEIGPNTSLTFHWNYIKSDNSLPELEYQNSTISAGLVFHF